MTTQDKPHAPTMKAIAEEARKVSNHVGVYAEGGGELGHDNTCVEAPPSTGARGDGASGGVSRRAAVPVPASAGAPSRSLSREVLRECPFCGGPCFARSDDDGMYYVSCLSVLCIARECGNEYKTEAEAIAAWNRRPVSPVQRQEMACGHSCKSVDECLDQSDCPFATNRASPAPRTGGGEIKVSDFRDRCRQQMQIILSSADNMSHDAATLQDRAESADMLSTAVRTLDGLLRELDRLQQPRGDGEHPLAKEWRERATLFALDSAEYKATCAWSKLGDRMAAELSRLSRPAVDWEMEDRLEALGTFGGRVVYLNGNWKVMLGEQPWTNCELMAFKSEVEAEEWLNDAIEKSGYTAAENPVFKARAPLTGPGGAVKLFDATSDGRFSGLLLMPVWLPTGPLPDGRVVVAPLTGEAGEIVGRLRGLVRADVTDAEVWDRAITEAVTLIERQAAEIERLNQRDGLFDTILKEGVSHRERAEAAEARVRDLEAADVQRVKDISRLTVERDAAEARAEKTEAALKAAAIELFEAADKFHVLGLNLYQPVSKG